MDYITPTHTQTHIFCKLIFFHSFVQFTRRTRGTTHVPLGADIAFVEIDLRNVVGKEVLQFYDKDLKSRRISRERKEKTAIKEEKKLQRIHDAEVRRRKQENSFHRVLDSSDFPSFEEAQSIELGLLSSSPGKSISANSSRNIQKAAALSTTSKLNPMARPFDPNSSTHKIGNPAAEQEQAEIIEEEQDYGGEENRQNEQDEDQSAYPSQRSFADALKLTQEDRDREMLQRQRDMERQKQREMKEMKKKQIEERKNNPSSSMEGGGGGGGGGQKKKKKGKVVLFSNSSSRFV